MRHPAPMILDISEVRISGVNDLNLRSFFIAVSQVHLQTLSLSLYIYHLSTYLSEQITRKSEIKAWPCIYSLYLGLAVSPL